MSNHPAPFPLYMLDELAKYLRAYRRHLQRPLDILDHSTNARPYDGPHGPTPQAPSELRNMRNASPTAAQQAVQSDLPRRSRTATRQPAARNVQEGSASAQSATSRDRSNPLRQSDQPPASRGQGCATGPLEDASSPRMGESQRPGSRRNDHPPRQPDNNGRPTRQFVADLAGWSSPGAPTRIREEAERSRGGGFASPLWVLDNFAGIGRVHDLADVLDVQTVGIEIEPEWAQRRARTLVGDATALPVEWSNLFDCVATSCVYGNRMSDHHDAKDSCAACHGIGVNATPDGCADAPMFCPDCSSVACACGGLGIAMKAHVNECEACSARRCPSCSGSGLSKRYTYRHALGRPLHERNAGQMQWPSNAYRTLHEEAWAEAFRVLRPGGIILLNIKNHIRQGKEMLVAEWHRATLQSAGFRILTVAEVDAPGLRHGANAAARVIHERILVGRKP